VARLETKQVETLLKILEEANRSILQKIRLAPPIVTDGSGYSRDDLKIMLREFSKIYKEAISQMSGQLELDMRKFADQEAEWARSMLEKQIPIEISLNVPSPAQVWSLVTTTPMDRGHLLADYLDSLSTAVQNRVTVAVRQGVIEGETNDQIARRLEGTKLLRNRDGVLEASRRNTETVVRTAVQHVASTAHQRTYLENQDVIKGATWNATLDGTTCAECGELDGKEFDLETGPFPPLHLNCRCVRTPILKSWKELGLKADELPEGTRASMDGQVPASLKYSEWIKMAPNKLQDEILGPARAEMLRGGAEISRFVNHNGGGLKPLNQL